MYWQNRLTGKLWLLLLLSLLTMLLSACDRGLWRAMDKVMEAEARLAAVERLAANALSKAEEAKALAEKAGGVPTPICTPEPGGARSASEGGVALRVESAISPTLQLYPVSEVKVYGKDDFAGFIGDSAIPMTATIMLAVTGATTTPETFTLYGERASAHPTGPNLSWHIYSLLASAEITQSFSNLLLTPALGISRTNTFSVPAGSRLDDSLAALDDVGVTRSLIRRLLLVRQENNQAVYTLVIFEGDGSGAGNSRACIWCRNCGSACSGICRRLGC